MRKGSNGWVFVLFLLAGIVIGGLLGELTAKAPYLGWLSYGMDFGLKSPVSLDLSVISIQFALMIRITVAGIIGMALGVFLFRKM